MVCLYSGISSVHSFSPSFAAESSILVAMRSQLYPTPDQEPQFDTMDLNLSLDMPQPPLPQSQTEWEAWGEESTIELCEVQLGFDGHSSSMSALFHKLLSLHPSKTERPPAK